MKEKFKVLVVGDNHCWGKGETFPEAKKNAQYPRYFVVFIVHPETFVDDMGWIVSPPEYEAREIWRRTRKVKNVKVGNSGSQ